MSTSQSHVSKQSNNNLESSQCSIRSVRKMSTDFVELSLEMKFSIPADLLMSSTRSRRQLLFNITVPADVDHQNISHLLQTKSEGMYVQFRPDDVIIELQERVPVAIGANLAQELLGHVSGQQVLLTLPHNFLMETNQIPSREMTPLWARNPAIQWNKATREKVIQPNGLRAIGATDLGKQGRKRKTF